MHASALSEVLWEVIESLYKARAHLVTNFSGSLLANRAMEYAEAVMEERGPLYNCVGFIYSTKIQMSRPSGPFAYQRSAYSGHNRFHCLIYQIITTPDGLIFHIYGPDVGQRHYTTLYRNS